jgi:NDP-sugar pyrophosphorylase family protein
MKIDCCLILCAGLGTRMGPIGKILPKSLWPLFEKKILDLQISFAKSLGVEKIYINAHHCSEQIKNFIELFNKKNRIKVNFLHEPILLGSGGGVHNLAALEKYQGNLLYLAGDQFYFFDKKYLEIANNLLNENSAVLFGLNVNKSDPYNRLIVENGLLKSIEKPHESSSVTFSGMGLIELKKLKPCPGESSFFDSVANFKEQNIYIITPKNSEYWDFGTSKNYFDSCFRLLEVKDGPFLEFCKKEGIFEKSYGTYQGKNLINLSKKRVNNPKDNKAIVIDYQGDLLEIQYSGIYLNDISERLSC